LGNSTAAAIQSAPTLTSIAIQAAFPASGKYQLTVTAQGLASDPLTLSV
jgi:hypothetical protein